MNIFIYYSTYIIFFGFLYYYKIIKYNPFIYLIFALLFSIFAIIYLIYNNANKYQLVKYIILNSPKLLLLFIIDNKNIFTGFVFYTITFIIYLTIILTVLNNNIYNIYYTETIRKILNNEF